MSSLFPLIGCVSLGQPFNLLIPHLPSKVIGQEAGRCPVLKVALYHGSPTWSLCEYRRNQTNAYLPQGPLASLVPFGSWEMICLPTTGVALFG